MIGRDTIVKSQRVSGLRVRGYRSSLLIDLPPAYTKDCIPVNRDHIPTCETAKKWNHLSKIVEEMPPLQDCEVGLLIGYNCARAMAPRDVISGRNEEPYAVRTDLGWSIVGGLSPCLYASSTVGQCFRVAVKEIPSVTPADAIRILESDFKDAKEDRKPVSQDDILFLDKMKNNIKRNSQGHYEMPLPFKERPTLPDNKQLAIMRLSHLKRKLLRDERYKEQYVKFMEEVIDKGDAEEVHDEGKEGEKWYIPHHGVYHAKKPDKLRIVFDCSAKYKGNSLNDHLLTGPDLMNNLNGVVLRFRLHSTALMCDIEKMFHQFHVRNSDQDYLRFLWWKKGDLSAQPQEYRMRVHIRVVTVTTIPRLELTAAVISVKTSNVLKKELGCADIEEYFWTDSKVILGYINNEARRFHTFVANHIQKIHLNTTQGQWRYVPTKKEKEKTKRRWRHIQYLVEQFWSRWRKEYLSNIVLRQRWHTPKRNLQLGDIVMMKDEGLPRNEWRLARVVQATKNRDGLVRRVKICLGDNKLGKNGERLTKQSVLERPVQKLVLLLHGD
uniref:DUF5641 domain-containing protein n=1 Tax=Nothobranchius furzeri TaxID=105023 RepID=A0A1A8V575_NOTFU